MEITQVNGDFQGVVCFFLCQLIRESSEQGLLREAEDMIDVAWYMIPEEDKPEDRRAEYEDSNLIRPPGEDRINGVMTKLTDKQKSDHRANRERVLKKLQCWSNVINQYPMTALYKKVERSYAEDLDDDIMDGVRGVADKLQSMR